MPATSRSSSRSALQPTKALTQSVPAFPRFSSVRNVKSISQPSFLSSNFCLHMGRLSKVLFWVMPSDIKMTPLSVLNCVEVFRCKNQENHLCDVIGEDDSFGPLVVHASYGGEPLLARCVPFQRAFIVINDEFDKTSHHQYPHQI